VQKYEKGVNRMGASRLSQFATTLQVSVERFFEGLPKEKPGVHPATPDYTRDFLATADGVALAKAFVGIKSPAVRKLCVPKTSSVLIQSWNRVTSRDHDCAVMLHS
jgi:hypothetical protein